jgi:hypothetical protein
MSKIVDAGGHETTLTAYQKNALYKQAKELREHINESRLTKDEHWDASQKNIQKFLTQEGAPHMIKKVELFRQQMAAIGADPSDIKLPEYRR